MVTIEIDGKKVQVRQGAMVIEAADELGVAIPRFCYHPQLSIAANCRMCLVDIANAPKALPACATPVSEGMKILTRSAKAIDAQQAVMEFLLINHPLDCPICDQGGECELQDVALEYGNDRSYYSEPKRVVKDQDVGPLITTELTRCIHCTRCVRFGDEIAGMRELGATGRGEHMEIGTYIEKSISSEISGNVIDICPVGALTSKPFRFSARTWELKSKAGISPHDCLGTNLFYHTHHQKVKRVVPRENAQLNEVWLSDRDRFAYEGLHSEQRLYQPQIKQQGKWQTVEWSVALQFATEKLQALLNEAGPQQLGALAAPSATVEEFYLLQQLMRQLGSPNIDHRLQQLNTQDQSHLPVYPNLGLSLEQLEQVPWIALIGSNVRQAQPLLNVRIRKATNNGAKVVALNPYQFDFNYPLAQAWVPDQGDLCSGLAELTKALLTHSTQVDAALAELLQHIEPSTEAKAMAVVLTSAPQGHILLGEIASSHPKAPMIRYLSYWLAQLTGATIGELTPGSNSAGGWIAGAVPARCPNAQPAEHIGLSVLQMFQAQLKGFILLNLEPEYDCANPRLASEALQQAQCVVSLTPFVTEHMLKYADVLLPIATAAETAGTYVNTLGQWQRFNAAIELPGDTKPAWKVLRVLGNLMNLTGFDYTTLPEVIQALTAQGMKTLDPTVHSILSQTWDPLVAPSKVNGLIRLAPMAVHCGDNIVRRASALQATPYAQAEQAVRLNLQSAQALHLEEGAWVQIFQDNRSGQQNLMVAYDSQVPNGCVMLPTGLASTRELGATFQSIELRPV
jgi:NADH-quinone oxidoreductase subunit G